MLTNYLTYSRSVWAENAWDNALNTWDIMWLWLLFERCLSFHYMIWRYQPSFSRQACNTNEGNFQKHKQDSHVICAFEYLLSCSCVVISVIILDHAEQWVVWSKLAKIRPRTYSEREKENSNEIGSGTEVSSPSCGMQRYVSATALCLSRTTVPPVFRELVWNLSSFSVLWA